jgi:hypothetical protein
MEKTIGRSINQTENNNFSVVTFYPTSGYKSLAGEMPQEVHNLLDVTKHVFSDYKLVGLAAINPEDDALKF